MHARVIGALLLVAALPASAQEVTLRGHTLLPTKSTGVSGLMQPWCDKVTKESGGKLKCQIFPSMQLGGTPPQLVDQVKDGVVDTTWTVLGYTPGRFPASEVFEIPFMTKTAEGSSRAFWEYAAANNLFASEFKDYKLIALHVHDRGYLHTNKPVKTLEDFKGMKIRGATRLTAKMVAAFGATPVGMPVTQVPESLSKSVIDGAVLPWEIVPAVKVHELVKYHVETAPSARALYASTFFYAMNPAKYASLPPELKKVVDANVGAETSQWAGRTWDASGASARKLAEARGNSFYTVPEQELARWQQAAAPIAEEWVKEVTAKGMDGAALLKSARELIAKFDK